MTEHLAIGRLILQLRRLERYPKSFGDLNDLSLSEVHTIEAIGEHEGVAMGELSDRLCVTKGAVSQMMVRLERKELVVRNTHPSDARIVLVSLTDKGRIAYETQAKIHEAIYMELKGEFTSSELRSFERCMERLTQTLRDR
ncbi:MarR family transcriptional regulator [Paenibacillus sp. UMB4589-SE434]|nr:MarR family transcriptional regulator [Paenibacillus sp. UMB4589-SE434]MDK8181080.1 MarR family transcriptional regulator [Paenibacillus sp. UMB4589-SE434]